MIALLQRLARYNLMMLAGALATLALFYTMQRLILTDFAAPEATTSFRIADITMPELEFVPVITTPKPLKPEEPPVIPDIDFLPPAVAGGSGTGVTFEAPDFSDPIEPGDYLGFADANAVALVQVQAVYPQRALQRGIEGYVIVEFDVDEAGLVINPRVLFAEPEGYFEAAALKALERYRYKPKLVGGREVKMFGVQQKLSFTLED
jgi:protein TonB